MGVSVSGDVTAQAVPTSPSARRLGRPRWRDARLLGGLLLVLLSVVLGARLLAAADDTVPVWSVTEDLAAGSTLQADDLRVADVRLGTAAGAYVGTSGQSPVGWVTTREVSAGELLAVSAIAQPGDVPALRNVTVAVEKFHVPGDLARGQRVDVYVTPKDGTTQVVMTDALVADLVQDGGRLGPSGDSVGVVLAVPPEQVAALVQGAQDGAIDLVRVPVGQ